ncbi:MAG: RidA family protein [Deltaproteobacteria bacterium]|nr:RidA family protein [Deltaproteobacteria bacterium]
MTKTAIQTGAAPAAIGPYSQAVEVDGWIFCSGQIALVPGTGEMLAGDAAAQTRQVMSNLAAVLAAAGASWADVVKTTIYLADLRDFAAANRIYEAELDKAGARPAPARVTIQAAGLPKGAAIEMDAIARVEDEP